MGDLDQRGGGGGAGVRSKNTALQRALVVEAATSAEEQGGAESREEQGGAGMKTSARVRSLRLSNAVAMLQNVVLLLLTDMIFNGDHYPSLALEIQRGITGSGSG